MTILQILTLPLAALCACAAWTATDVSRRWIARVDLACARIPMKARAYHMGLTEKQIYDQFALRQPMHAPRLEELWAACPGAGEAYHIAYLEEHGYRCFREAWLLGLIAHVSDQKKAMASMALAGTRRRERA